MSIINNAGQAWLSGPKYALSARFAGPAWEVPVEVALERHGLRQLLDQATTIHDVVRVFRGRFFWKPDPVLQMWDVVLPPELLLAAKGDDCDGWAMTHTQAILYALGRFGWTAFTVSYLAEPFTLSHHFTAARDPQGRWWAIQPQPTEADWKEHGERNQTVFGPFGNVDEAVAIVASGYQARIAWWDKRDGLYRPLT